MQMRLGLEGFFGLEGVFDTFTASTNNKLLTNQQQLNDNKMIEIIMNTIYIFKESRSNYITNYMSGNA